MRKQQQICQSLNGKRFQIWCVQIWLGFNQQKYTKVLLNQPDSGVLPLIYG